MEPLLAYIERLFTNNPTAIVGKSTEIRSLQIKGQKVVHSIEIIDKNCCKQFKLHENKFISVH